MKLRIAFLFLLMSSALYAQELIQTDYEKGYVKDGKRYSVWQYFNSNKEVELAINHTTGKVMYVIPDTSDYVILKDGEWINAKLDIHPVPVSGYYNFYDKLWREIVYPDSAYSKKIEGKVIVQFEVDTLGNSVNLKIAKHISDECDSAVLKSVKAINQKWVPARLGGKTYSSRFALKIDFRLKDRTPTNDSYKGLNIAKELPKEIVVTHVLSEVFTFVDQSAEPVDGLPGFYKWVGKNLRYPYSARRMGLEGKVFVKFIIEPDGKITNAEVVKGFNVECNKEALRLISSSPNWKPGTQNGRPVRQLYTLPIAFKLAE